MKEVFFMTKQHFTIGDICKEIQRIQFDIEIKKDYESAITRCENLDELLCDIELGKYDFNID